MKRPVISFLSDFGADAAAAICRGVMIDIARDAQVIDVTHGVRKYAIRDGAFLLWCAVPWLPVGVHVAVVDPGVGTTRRPLGLRTARGDILIGPDNGLLMPAAERLGGIVEARALDERSLMLPVTTSTFHGRDIFSPVAAHLAAGVTFDAVGPVVDPTTLVQLSFPGPDVGAGRLRSAVLYVDSFGNLRLAGGPADLAAAVGPTEPGSLLRVTFGTGDADQSTIVSEVISWASTFGQVPRGAALLYEDSSGGLAYADNQGSVAARLGIDVDRTVLIERA